MELSSLAVEGDGTVAEASVSVDTNGIYVSFPVSNETSYPLVLTTYLASDEDSDLLDGTRDTLEWIMSPDSDLTEEDIELWETIETETNSVPPSTPAPLQEDPQLTPQPESASLEESAPVAKSAAKAIKRPTKITIPTSYRYCPKTCKPKERHDYCSFSPDKWRQADFRGPCARHDMGIATISKLNVSVTSKRSQRANVDTVFGKNLKRNCAHAYYSDTVTRTSCNTVAAGYLYVVSKKTDRWDGK